MDLRKLIRTIDIDCVKMDPEAIVPTYGREDDAGLDLYALNAGVIPPLRRVTIRTGIAMQIPPGYVGLVWDRGGLGTIEGLRSLAGVIDSNYRGEIFVTLFNTDSSKAYPFYNGDRIAQMVIQPVMRANMILVSKLSDSCRGDKCFSSSGR